MVPWSPLCNFLPATLFDPNNLQLMLFTSSQDTTMHSWFSLLFFNSDPLFVYMVVSENRATPSHHPFLDGIFHEINHPAIGFTPWLYGNPHFCGIWLIWGKIPSFEMDDDKGVTTISQAKISPFSQPFRDVLFSRSDGERGGARAALRAVHHDLGADAPSVMAWRLFTWRSLGKMSWPTIENHRGSYCCHCCHLGENVMANNRKP